MKPSDKEMAVGVLLLIALVLGGKLAWAQLVHHDLRCAFAECRIETP